MTRGTNHATVMEGDKTNVEVSMLESGDTIILIVGMMGVGKNTFINEAVGCPATTINKAGDDVNFSDMTVRPVISSRPDDSTRRLVFLDTPGCDLTWGSSDTQVLKNIAVWLQAASCKKKATLGGIIYLYDDISQACHRLNSERFAMFYRPEGTKEVKNVVLATMKLSQPMNDDHKHSEEQLCTDDKLARFQHRQFMNTGASAWEIVELLLKEEQLDNPQFRQAADKLARSAGVQKKEKLNNHWGFKAKKEPGRKPWKRKDVKNSDDLVPVPGARHTDVIIPVMGPTGTGKSTFINVAAGKEVTPVGIKLQSCTSTILPVVVPFPNNPERRIVFVDTPGFDDTFLEDTEVLRRIAVWMAFAYDENMKLAGIIYLHDISQKCMLGTMRKNFLMFNRLTGIKAAKSVVLATTMWDEVGKDVGKGREEELSTTFWKDMLEQESHMRRFLKTHKSAWDIVDEIIGTGEIEALLIQEEMVDLQKRIPTTEAGKALRNSLQELLKEQKVLAGKLKKEAKEDEHLWERYREVEKQLQSTMEQIKDLKVPLGKRVMAVFFP